MSQHLKMVLSKGISYNALRVACETPHVWHEAWTQSEFDQMLVESLWRFQFEAFIRLPANTELKCDCTYSFKSGNVKKIRTMGDFVLFGLKKVKANKSPKATPLCKHSGNIQAHIYTAMAFLRNQPDFQRYKGDDDETKALKEYFDEKEQELTKAGELQRIAGFYATRSMLTPVIETMLCLDRLLAVIERSNEIEDETRVVQAGLLPLFDPAISPRNVMIYALRE